MLLSALHFILHLDQALPEVVASWGAWVYVLLFGIIFAETGFVVTPFLPGDSLLFVAGSLSANGALNPWITTGALVIAAVLGNTSNYWIGRYFGPRVFHWEQSRWFNRRALDETHAFYERYGGVTLTLARFMPIVRTFAPFVAGVGAMDPVRFQLWNALGAWLWIGLLIGVGYFFGNLPFVQHHMSALLLGVVVVSVLPMLVGAARARLKARAIAD